MASELGFSRERYFVHNTLLCLIKGLENNNAVFDLRDDSYVCGKVTSIDGFMNCSLTEAIFCDSRGNEYFFELFFVQARNIRYIHIPNSMPIVPTIKEQLDKFAPGKKKPKDSKEITKSRKTKKTLKRHMEVVASLEDT